jgi:exosortase
MQLTGSLLLLLGAALAFSVAYWPTAGQMLHAWRTHPYAGHGVFVPAMSLIILWGDWARVRAAAAPGSLGGAALVLGGFGLLLLGRLTQSLLIAGLSVIPVIAGLVVWGFGVRCLAAAAFPVGFLVFMPPLPQPIVDAVTRELQLFAAGFAGIALELVGVPFYQDGLFIRLATLTLEVAEVCNGLRFLVALLVLTIAFAHVSQRTLARKVVLAAAAVPAAVLANAIRVTMVALGAHFWGPEAASGWTHNLIGKSVWALTLLPLLALALWLRRGTQPRPAGRMGPIPAHQPAPGP